MIELSFVIAGLSPAISLMDATSVPINRDCRAKPGNDEH